LNLFDISPVWNVSVAAIHTSLIFLFNRYAKKKPVMIDMEEGSDYEVISIGDEAKFDAKVCVLADL
jgi:hypothetical protein